jgi:Polyketide cyclase / dehydrase and lipid transport
LKHRLSERIRVALPADEAFQLFTPRGERKWARGWDPTFPAPTDDDSEPGTVFETDAHGRRATWLVTDRERGRRIAYAQVVPDHRAGRITVTLEATNEGSEVEVVYELTPLSEAGEHDLEQFAENYGDFLRSWQDEIATCLTNRTIESV